MPLTRYGVPRRRSAHVIIDASVIIDAVADSGDRGRTARKALASHLATEPLITPGHCAVEVLSGLRAAANRPTHPLLPEDVPTAIADAEALDITIEGTPWSDIRRAWELAQTSLFYADAVYVATAERHGLALLTSDARIERSGAPISCGIVTVS